MTWIAIAKWVIAFLHSPAGHALVHLGEELLMYLWLHRPATVEYLPSLVEQFKAARNIAA